MDQQARNGAVRDEDDAPVALIDSSALVAMADRRDALHEQAVRAYQQLAGSGYRLFTTNYLIAETVDLLTAGMGAAIAQRWLRDHRLPVYHADEQDERRARNMVITTRRPEGLTMTDAISAVVMDRLGVHEAFAVDPNFPNETP
jgi:predicted nucleic acid-binding protein